jgi:hypothetical protein
MPQMVNNTKSPFPPPSKIGKVGKLKLINQVKRRKIESLVVDYINAHDTFNDTRNIFKQSK